MQHRSTTAVAAAIAALGAVAVTGCAHTAHTAAVAHTPAPASRQTPTAPQLPAPVWTVPPRTDGSWPPPFTAPLLALSDPTGTGPEIALRFLRDLQAGDDLGAAAELSTSERTYVAVHSLHDLQVVMADVMTNAHLDTAGTCTHAAPVNDEAAVVTCGLQQIVVHVRSGFLAGVQINSYFPHDDVYLGAHTHAYTSYDI